MTIFRRLGMTVWVWMMVVIASISFASPAFAFCGFYVTKADTSLYNKTSQVAIAREGDRTVLTMANDFQGDVSDFAMVIPVPVVLDEKQVKVASSTILNRLDAISAPRLVEYFDENPCTPSHRRDKSNFNGVEAPSSVAPVLEAQDLGVTIESSFSVGEYDILMLSATESEGLETWLRNNKYQLPNGASDLLRPYIRQGLKFFVAKVNIEEFDQSGFQQLRPLQISYESPRFMLPIRLGMMNAESEQDLVVYLLSPSGRTELTNYRTVNIPSNLEVPLFVKDEFSDFYTTMFERIYQQEGRKTAFLEYAWEVGPGKCDPCSAASLSPDELDQVGVFWSNPRRQSKVFITRLHVRYTRNKFPEDLIFQPTSNQQQYQGRYIITHPFTGEANCRAGKRYRRKLSRRFEQEAQNLARLTGWNINDIRQKHSPIPDIRSSRKSFWANIQNFLSRIGQ